MATQGRWLGDWPGAWWGSSGGNPGSLSGHASIGFSASGNLQTVGAPPAPELPFPGYGTFIPPKRRRLVEEDEALLLMELI